MILIIELFFIIAFRKHIYDFLDQDFQSSITHANEVGVPLHAKHCGWFDVTISASSSIGTSWYVLRNFSSSKISSPQPMAQVGFSKQDLSVVCRRRCCCRTKFFKFQSSSLKPLARFEPNLTKASPGKGDSSLFKMKGHARFKGEII